MIADGFGIHAKLIGKLHPDPKTGQLTAELRRPAAAAIRRIRHPSVRLRSRRAGDADPLHRLRGRDATSSPGTTTLARPELAQFVLSVNTGPTAPPARGRRGPSTRASTPAPRTRTPAASATSPEARPRRRRPVPRRPQLQDAAGLDRRPARASPTARRPRSPPPPERSAGPSWRARAARRSRRSAPPTSPPARLPPLPRGRQDVSGRAVQGRAALAWSAVTPALAGPYDYGVVVVRVAINVDPLDAHVIAVSDTVPVDHRRRPDPDALDPGQHRQAELHDQPDQLLARSPSTRRGSATRARSTDFSSYFHGGQLRRAAASSRR